MPNGHRFPLLLLILAASGAHAADSWPFQPAADGDSPAIDLRALNEPVAGAHGFVRRSADGGALVLGDGSPARFWAINASCDDANSMATEARFLARRGINLVRFMPNIRPDLAAHPEAKVDEINRAGLDNAWRWIAALKKEGIYSLLVPYWATGGPGKSWDIRGQSTLWGVLFCDTHMQAVYKAWVHALYTEKNPYTGLPIGQDPGVAMIQIQNEDSLLFWTIQGLIQQKGQPYDELRAGFFAFAAKKYGSIDKAYAAWNGVKEDGDEPAKERLGFLLPWNMMNNGAPEHPRAAAQLEYYATTMRDFYTGMGRYLREECGCKQLINACNWRPADAVKLFDAERWTYGGNDVMAVNRYIPALHIGPDNGWAVDPGCHYQNLSATLDPTQLILNCKQPVGYPFVITEGSWPTPDLYEAEAPLMIAAYSSLTGLAAMCWSGTIDPAWHEPIWSFGKMFKWSQATPTTIGQFPAAALIFRMGYARRGNTAVHEERTASDLWDMRPPLIADESGYDPNRDSGLPSSSAVKTTVDPLAYLVGRVEIAYDGDPAKSRAIDLTRYVDKAGKTVTSITGEERIAWGAGLFTLDAPKAQGCAGMLGKAGTVSLKDVDIACDNPYAAVAVVALDDRPLRESTRILVQIGTTIRPTGWKEHEEDFEVDASSHTKQHGFTVDAIGRNPWQVACAAGTVTIRNPGLAKATVLEPNLALGRPAEGKQDHGAFTLTLPPDALYVIIEH